MPKYITVVIGLNFLVDFLLLQGTNHLCGSASNMVRMALAAGLGGLYGGVCALPGFFFLGNAAWRIVSLLFMTVIAFGYSIGALRRGLVFALLCFASGGIALGVENIGAWKILVAAGGVFLLCRFGFGGHIGRKELVPVEIMHDGKKLRLTALRDTGNTLHDPVTGRSVLVVGAEVANKLTGLTQQQLKTPIESMGVIPGLRLVPYKTIGNGGGMLLARRFAKVKIGNWQGSSLVAFAPEGLCSNGEYQALTGGTV